MPSTGQGSQGYPVNNFERVVIEQLYYQTRAITRINHRLEHIMTALSDLQAAVAAEDTVIASAITLLNGLKAQLDAAIASGNPAALAQLSADIGAQTQAMSDAVANNTPAAP